MESESTVVSEGQCQVEVGVGLDRDLRTERGTDGEGQHVERAGDVRLEGVDAEVALVWEPAWNQGMISEEGRMILGLV